MNHKTIFNRRLVNKKTIREKTDSIFLLHSRTVLISHFDCSFFVCRRSFVFFLPQVDEMIYV